MSSEEELAAWLREVVTEDGRRAAKRLRRACSDDFRRLTMERLARAKAELAILDACPLGTICRDGPEAASLAEHVVRLLGYGYRHRPGYREEWKP